MSNFLTKPVKDQFQSWMDDAGDGSIILINYSQGGPSPYQKSLGKWYACGVRNGFTSGELMEVDNITEVQIIWEDVYLG